MWRKWANFQEHISHEVLGQFPSNLVCRVAYIQGIKYMILTEIGLVVIELWGVENGKFAVPVNNTLMCHTAFLAADIRPCLDHKLNTQRNTIISTVKTSLEKEAPIIITVYFYLVLPYSKKTSLAWTEFSARNTDWPSMRDCFNQLEASSNYSDSVLQTNNTNSITVSCVKSQKLYISQQPCLLCYGNHCIHCSTLYRLEVVFQSCVVTGVCRALACQCRVLAYVYRHFARATCK